MKHLKSNILLWALVVIVSACEFNNNAVQTSDNESYWESEEAWYQSDTTVNDDKIDLFYIVSTNVLSAEDENGDTAYQTRLNENDRKAYDAEFRYVEKHFCQSDFNYFAPYYHQFTFEAISLEPEKYQEVYSAVSDEVCDAFDYYMEHKNNGRRFALVGFSQGAMLSFNSALSTDGVWPLVAEGAVTCINPVNWKTDSTPANFTYEGEEHSVSIDKGTNMLIVKTNRPEHYRKWTNNPAFQSAKVHLDCLHHWDLLFYSDFIHDNILKRLEDPLSPPA